MNNSVSPSKTYVAMCDNGKFSGYHFKKFTLPEFVPNNSDHASWYYLNYLDMSSCIEGCITIEDFTDMKEAEIPEFVKFTVEALNNVAGTTRRSN